MRRAVVMLAALLAGVGLTLGTPGASSDRAPATEDPSRATPHPTDAATERPSQFARETAGGSTVCTKEAVERTYRRFLRAFNGGDRATLARLFASDGFLWYSTTPPGARSAPAERSTLISYLLRRHRRAERLEHRRFVFGGLDHGTGAFSFELVRSAADVPRKRYLGKGGTQCNPPRPQIFVWAMAPKRT